MKRILPVILILFLVCGCKTISNTFTQPNEPIIIAPSPSAEETADGYKKILPEDEITYYVNKESKKIHLPTCRYAKIMAESKILLEKDLEKLLLKGYTPCGVCKPQ